MNSQINSGLISTPVLFEKWAYPPQYEPRHYTGTIPFEADKDIDFEAVAGLAAESSPATGEYGVYFYCNDRLISRATKSFDVGFAKGFAGVPHPKVSLTRVLVYLRGSARAMPWNSSKSEINTHHPVFLAMRNWLLQVVKDYAYLSRNWVGEWETKVFRYTSGAIKDVEVADLETTRKSYLPPLPKSRPRYGDQIARKNQKIVADKPWTRGLYEGVVAADLLLRQGKLDQRNRIALMVLDSTIEIAFKEYLVHDTKHHYSDSELSKMFKQRHLVGAEIQKYVTIDSTIVGKLKHYHDLRNKLTHERATVNIDDKEIDDFRKTVESVLQDLYKLKGASGICVG